MLTFMCTAIIVLIVVAAIALSSYATASAKAALPAPKPQTAMRDMAVGGDDPITDEEGDVEVSDGELEKLLRDSGLDIKGKMVDQGTGVKVGTGVTRKGKQSPLDVDRI